MGSYINQEYFVTSCQGVGEEVDWQSHHRTLRLKGQDCPTTEAQKCTSINCPTLLPTKLTVPPLLAYWSKTSLLFLIAGFTFYHICHIITRYNLVKGITVYYTEMQVTFLIISSRNPYNATEYLQQYWRIQVKPSPRSETLTFCRN